MSRTTRTLCAISAFLAGPSSAFAQSQPLPPIIVSGSAGPTAPTAPAASEQTPASNNAANARGQQSLTVLTVEQARKEIDNTPGGVAVVPAEAFDPRAATIKD